MKTRRLLVTVVALTTAVVPVLGQVDTGTADFTRYASIGDSLAAGFSSGSLHEDGQANSFPALISRQARGSNEFQQPLVGAPGIPSILTLQSLAPLVIGPTPGQAAPLNLNLPRPYDNMAVPGARAGDVVRTRAGGLNDLILRGLGTQLELVASLQPTFTSIWIGNNDVLAAATSGIVVEGVTLTPTSRFEADLRTIVGTLAAVGVGGTAIATIPSVVSIPYVTALPPVLVDPATNQPVIGPDGQLVPLIGPEGPLVLGDNVLLPASAFLAQGIGIPAPFGTGQPLPDGVVLSAAETATIEARREEFNAIIRAVAGESGAALVDVAAIFEQVLRRGIVLGGIALTTDYLTGGLFSLDGVHASPIGYAIIANAFIEAVNATYGGSIPAVAMEPFMLGGLGRLPGSPGSLTTTGSGSFVFTASSYENLRRTLNVPKEKRLLRIRKRRERRAAGDMSAATESRPSKAMRRDLRERRRELRRVLRAQ